MRHVPVVEARVVPRTACAFWFCALALVMGASNLGAQIVPSPPPPGSGVPSSAVPPPWGRDAPAFAIGLWVVRHDLATPEGLAEVVDRASRVGCTDLFFQVRGRGDAYYRSQLVPRAPEVPLAFDPLAAAVELAHRRGMRAHAWLNMLLVWSSPGPPVDPRHVARTHPAWFMTLDTDRGKRPTLELGREELDRLGIAGHFLDPRHPEVAAHLSRVVEEVVRQYAVDGVHFDYLRYPDRQALEAGAAETLTALVGHLALSAKRQRPEVVVSAAVYPDPEAALARKGQDWPGWLADGRLDLAVPMCYGASKQEMTAELEAARRAGGVLWAGIALYNKPVAVAVKGVAAARERDYDGVVFFSHAQIRELGETALQLVPAPTPHVDETPAIDWW